MSEIDRSLLEIFSVEQAEHVSRLRKLLAGFNFGDIAGNAAVVEEILRSLHTLKGAARAVGLEITETLTHQSEEVFSRARRGIINGTAGETFGAVLDAIEDVLAAVIAGRAMPDIAGLMERLRQLAGIDADPVPSVPGVPRIPEKTGEPEPEGQLNTGAPAAQLRVNARNIDELIRESAELLMEAPGDDSPATHAAHVDEVVEEWTRLRRGAARALTADVLSEDENLRPLMGFLKVMDSRLDALRREARNLADRDSNNRRSLRDKAQRTYQSACRVRMTPAEGVLGAFGPMVRDLAHQESKQVSFNADGLDTEADRLVLQGLKDPVMHLLRNAVSHGIETAADRERTGKPAQGNIRLKVRSLGDRLELVVEDDGRGLDRSAILEAAKSRGIETTESEIEKLVFRSGFSTARMVTGVSGRGMGLSVVQRAVHRLRGEIRLSGSNGTGTAVSLSVPISISTQHVLLVSAADHTFGLPAASVQGLDRVRPADIRMVNGREAVVTDTGPLPLRELADLLGLKARSQRTDEKAQISYVVLTGAGRSVAVAVDRLLDERQAIIKDTGLAESRAGMTAGAIPLEDGRVAVMLSVNKLFEGFDLKASSSIVPDKFKKTQARKKRILVVDDSLTTRSLERSILEAHGYQVQLAVDGLEALERLSVEIPDLVISDVSMPRMTGFQLLERIKSDEAMKKIPVILVTSLETPEEQKTGLSLGADAYIVKRKFDQRELLNVIQQII